MTGCGDRPREVLPEDRMVDLLVDMELAEAYANTQASSSTKNRVEFGKRVLEAHGVSEETLDTTLAWYGRNIDDYTALFEKVDKEINRRREKYIENHEEALLLVDNLWPYAEHLIVSPLSGENIMSFSLPYPEIEKGQLLEFSFYLPNTANLKTSFGAQYQEGGGEAISSTFNSKRNIKLVLQTDTGRTVSRLYGMVEIKDMKQEPLYLDSISIKAEPIDSTGYKTKRRTQKSFW